MVYPIIIWLSFCYTSFEKETALDPYMDVLYQTFEANGIITKDECLFERSYNLIQDILIVQERISHITPETPPIDALPSIPRENAEYNIELQGFFESYIEYNYGFVAPQEQRDFDLLLEDLEKRRTVWSAIRALKYNYRDRKGIRLRMHELMNLVGKDNFYSGKWPDPLPTAANNGSWNFTKEFNQIP